MHSMSPGVPEFGTSLACQCYASLTNVREKKMQAGAGASIVRSVHQTNLYHGSHKCLYSNIVVPYPISILIVKAPVGGFIGSLRD